MNQVPAQAGTAGSSVAEWGLQAAQSMLRRMLDSADDTLFDLSGGAKSDLERRGYFDTMRLLRKSGAALAKRFEQALRADASSSPAARPDPPAAVTLSLRADDDVQQAIASANAIQRVENAAQQRVWEFGLRIDQVPGASQARLQLEALRPKALVAAFNLALSTLQLTSDVRTILIKLFERQLLADINPYLESLNGKLATKGYTAAMLPVRPRRDSGVDAAGAVSTAPPSYSVPAAFVNSLSQWGVPGSAWSEAPKAPGDFTAGAPQRLTLINQLIEEIGSRWPSEELEALRRLVLPIIQIALADSRFFSDPSHPARMLISGLEVLASEPDLERGTRLAEAEAALRNLQQQYRAPSSVAPLSQAELQGFLSAQRSPKASTSARMNSARAAAHEQIKSAGSGYELPVGLAPFLGEVWMPLVCALSLRFGVGSAEWKRARALLQRLFGECRWLTGHVEPALVDTILDDVSGEMKQMGVPPHLVQRAAMLLREGLSNPGQAQQRLDLETFGARPRSPVAPEATKATGKAASALDRIVDWRAAVPVGAWFRVFDRQTNRTLWMAADVFYPESTSVSFTGFDPTVRVNVGKLDFLRDLRDGKAEAVNPSAAQAEAIGHLVATIAKPGPAA